MKFERYDFMVEKNWIDFPLCIHISINDMLYMRNNFSIIFSFLCFHFRWLFTESVKE